ncbi:Hypothetical predicted protein [Paramuricea clavata]|uniref:Uncharacterized protein n=1 Tax=Paramuricea clavata TaxID=317549 RepID=A0A6S7ICN3_PARCT|nr:Hypothetical predicted protein [Paramuricea clavata]
MLRSRTVRCLTKQIQQRCGDSNMQLPRWSVNTDKEIIRDPNDSFTNSEPYLHESVAPETNDSPNESTTIMKSENLNNTIYENCNGFEKTYETSSNFDRTVDVFEENNAQNKSEVLQKQSGNGHQNGNPQLSDEDKLLHEDKINTSTVSDRPKDSLDTENPQKGKNINTIVQPRKGGKNNTVTGTETRQEASFDSYKLEKVKEDFSLANSIHDERKHDSEQQFVNSHAADTGVQLFLNVSNFNSDESDGETPRVNSISKHILEPVEERVTVEVLQPRQSGVAEMSEKEGLQVGYNAPKLVDEDSHTNALKTSSDRPDSMLNSETEETSSKSNVKTMGWDPSLLIKRILGKVKPVNTEEVENADAEEIHMAGYLEKLPVNQKKATLLKSWRKRYFKILHGKLFYFEDHRSAAPISFIKLGGCQVVEMGSKCLAVTENDEDLGGRMVVIRCGSWPELQDWRKALESEAKTKVKRQHFELVQEKKQVIIIDFGSSSIKAGFLEDQAWPQVIIPSVYAINKEDSKSRLYGYEAITPLVRNTCKLVYPLRSPLTIGKYLLDPNDLIGFLEIIFQELQVDPSQYQVVMTTPVNLRDQDKERLVEMLFDYFQVATVYMKCQAILSMYSYSATCGIVVNIGDHIDVVPIEEGYVVESGMNSLPYGGRQVTDHFMRLLSSSGYRYFSDVENYIAEYLKVKTCYVSQDFSKETEQFSESDYLTVDMSEFDLPSGDKLVTVTNERFTAFEGLFKPELWGKDNPSIPDMVYNAVMACSIDNRKEMCRNIFLSGATTKIPGFADRLQTELSGKFPSSLVIQVHAARDRQFAAFIGAAVLASLESFADLCISRDDWEETGPELLKKWDGV